MRWDFSGWTMNEIRLDLIALVSWTLLNDLFLSKLCILVSGSFIICSILSFVSMSSISRKLYFIFLNVFICDANLSLEENDNRFCWLRLFFLLAKMSADVLNICDFTFDEWVVNTEVVQFIRECAVDAKLDRLLVIW